MRPSLSSAPDPEPTLRTSGSRRFGSWTFPDTQNASFAAASQRLFCEYPDKGLQSISWRSFGDLGK
ncbi:protein of unknown function (plasmid) [Methylocella tundrae]|uniref:Uncharacterized protein n=1 Tax=Methylocella tundrae TaxID=227605 RepID=A0A4V6IND9_METTU|nr:protein of unknown function [Methylocella tundrae]